MLENMMSLGSNHTERQYRRLGRNMLTSIGMFRQTDAEADAGNSVPDLFQVSTPESLLLLTRGVHKP